MNKQAKRINATQAEALRQVGYGHLIEERFYLLPVGSARRQSQKTYSGRPRGALGIDTKKRSRTAVILTGNEMSANAVKGSRLDVIFANAKTVLRQAARDNQVVTRLQLAKAAAVNAPFTYNTVTTTITHLIRGGYIRYVD